jgi:hypothetical protein
MKRIFNKNEEVLKKFLEVHGNIYDYSNADINYKNISDNKITIICTIHGSFSMLPYNHIFNKRGCPKCSNERAGKLIRINQEEFIRQAKEKHKDKYDYSLVNYQTMSIPVIIICSKHGNFLQRPNDHTQGSGCKKCSLENRYNYNIKEANLNNKNANVDIYVLEIYNDVDSFIKVGISKELNKRIINISNKSKHKAKLLLQYPCTLHEAVYLENYLKSSFKDYRKFQKKVFS